MLFSRERGECSENRILRYKASMDGGMVDAVILTISPENTLWAKGEPILDDLSIHQKGNVDSHPILSTYTCTWRCKRSIFQRSSSCIPLIGSRMCHLRCAASAQTFLGTRSPAACCCLLWGWQICLWISSVMANRFFEGEFDFVNHRKPLNINGQHKESFQLECWRSRRNLNLNLQLPRNSTWRRCKSYFLPLLNSDSLKYVFSKATNENKLVIKLATTTCSKKQGVVFQVMRIFLHANKGAWRQFQKRSLRNSLDYGTKFRVNLHSPRETSFICVLLPRIHLSTAALISLVLFDCCTIFK